jgi:asparaginyl-tRNA synthetase
MIEPEIAFSDLGDDMMLAEDMVKSVIRHVLTACPDEIAFFNSFVDKDLTDRLNLVANSDFGRLTYTEAVEILEKHKDRFEYPVYWGCDLQTEHEIPDRGDCKEACICYGLPERDQGFLYETKRRR